MTSSSLVENTLVMAATSSRIARQILTLMVIHGFLIGLSEEFADSLVVHEL
jgi:hypothetical protein